MSEKEFIFIEDNTHMEDHTKGHWVMIREDDDQAMILFTGLSKEQAERFKKRIDEAIKRRIKLAVDKFMCRFEVTTK